MRAPPAGMMVTAKPSSLNAAPDARGRAFTGVFAAVVLVATVVLAFMCAAPVETASSNGATIGKHEIPATGISAAVVSAVSHVWRASPSSTRTSARTTDVPSDTSAVLNAHDRGCNECVSHVMRGTISMRTLRGYDAAAPPASALA
ncbi:MAG: hypothetical protein JWM95_5298 [Gemmatimonadetes bacterium]|nr:hypothetical protein [Gemmatimonadota bacterium]